MAANTKDTLYMKNISKSFPGVRALDDVSFDVLSGEVHSLIGQNGAGKSTLMGILNGITNPDDGSIFVFMSVIIFMIMIHIFYKTAKIVPFIKI